MDTFGFETLPSMWGSRLKWAGSISNMRVAKSPSRYQHSVDTCQGIMMKRLTTSPVLLFKAARCQCSILPTNLGGHPSPKNRLFYNVRFD